MMILFKSSLKLIIILWFFNETHSDNGKITDYDELEILPNVTERKNWGGARKSGSKLINLKPNNRALNNQVRIERNLQTIFEILPSIDNKNCVKDVTHVLNGLIRSEKWALQLFDAFPKFPVGLMYGNLYQLGNFEECISVNHKTDDNIQIRGQYCLADIHFKLREGTNGIVETPQAHYKNSRTQFNSTVVHWALCLPSSCTPTDGKTLMTDILFSLIDFEILEVLVEDKYCYFETSRTISSGEIIYGSIIAFCLVFIFLATVLHIWYIRNRNKYNFNSYNIDTFRKQNTSTIEEIILSFSLVQTVTKFLQTTPTELNLECIGGIKFLSMVFILAGHSLIFIFGSPVANADFANTMISKVENSIFLNSPLLVDSFLLIGGFLICRLLLIEFDNRSGRINFIVLYVARYIRLTPAYMVVIGFYLTWLPNIADGPLWNAIAQTETSRCKQSWWTNILYVNNYIQTDELCMFQAWYLAADFHLFIIAPFLIYTLWKWPLVGLSLLVTITTSATILPGYITYRYSLDPTLLAFPPEIKDISTNFYFVNAYIKTHMRASAYFVGMLFGYFVHQIQGNCKRLPSWMIWVGWLLATIFGVCSATSIVLFLNPTFTHDDVLTALYTPLHRLAWSLAIGWVIVACVTENAAIVNKFLSWKLFIPLSRLTYCAYLINGLVLICYKGTTREAVSWTKLKLAFTLFGHLVTTFLLAFVLCICFESPIHGLEKILLKKKDLPHKPNPPATILKIVEDNENN